VPQYETCLVVFNVKDLMQVPIFGFYKILLIENTGK